MRLIDADALKKKMQGTDRYFNIKFDIDEAPTVDVLDKIRAEIERVLNTERDFTTESAKAQAIALNWCLEVIDKYSGVKNDGDI